MDEAEERVAVDLNDEERQMLVSGLTEWGGPAYGSEALAIAMGFTGLDDLYHEAERITAALQLRRPLTVRDWSRALVATEIAFGSDVLGAAGEWMSVHGGTDEEWLSVLRELQRKVPKDPGLLPP